MRRGGLRDDAFILLYYMHSTESGALIALMIALFDCLCLIPRCFACLLAVDIIMTWSRSTWMDMLGYRLG